jgi:hypothetical protein
MTLWCRSTGTTECLFVCSHALGTAAVNPAPPTPPPSHPSLCTGQFRVCCHTLRGGRVLQHRWAVGEEQGALCPRTATAIPHDFVCLHHVSAVGSFDSLCCAAFVRAFVCCPSHQDSIHMEAIEVISGSKNPGIAAFFPALVEDSKKIGACAAGATDFPHALPVPMHPLTHTGTPTHPRIH